MRRYAKVFYAVFTLFYIVTLANGDEDVLVDNTNRDKRTLDIVLRGFADIFGYDVQKRPTAIPPPPHKAPKPKPPPPPPKPTKATPHKITTPNLLKEIVKKSFKLNFNWKHKHGQPIIPIRPKKPEAPALQPPKMPPAMHMPPPKTTMMPHPVPPPPKHPMHPAPPPKMTASPEHPVHKAMKPMQHPAPPPKPTEKKMHAEDTPKKPEKVEHHLEEDYFNFQPEKHVDYETRYVHDYEEPVYYSKYSDTPAKQYEDVGKLKYDFDRNFKNVEHLHDKNVAPAAQPPEQHHDFEDYAGFNGKAAAAAPQHNFDRHYEDFVHFNEKNAAPQMATTEHHQQKQEVPKGELISPLHDFWQKSPMKNDHGYKFLVEEGAQVSPKENLRQATTETPQEDGSYFKTYFYYPHEDEDSNHKASEGHDNDFGLRITTTPNPHIHEVEIVPQNRPMKLKKVPSKANNENDNHGTFIPTKFEGDETFIPTKLQRLQNEDVKVFSLGPSPFDHEYDSSEVKATTDNGDKKSAVKNQAQPPEPVEEDPHQRFVYFYQPDSYDNDYTFTISPQQNVEATGVPKIDTVADDRDLSRNAKVETKEYAKRIVALHKNADTRMNAW